MTDQPNRMSERLYQIHHQFADRTEMCAQITSLDMVTVNTVMEELVVSHPIPEGAKWMVCNEDSEHFVWAADD